MTGIRFLDELSAPRRSTILPFQLQSAQRRASLQTKEATLADYAIAMAVDAPQLTPMLFREYSIADEQTQAELLVSLPSSPYHVQKN